MLATPSPMMPPFAPPCSRNPGFQHSAYPALVLNADFQPLSVLPLSVWDIGRTLRNVTKERVTVVATYDTLLRSPSFEYAPPSVVALKRFIKRSENAAFTRFNVFLRDGFRCQYCGEEHGAKSLTFDHVVPKSQGGASSWENIVAACQRCNSLKGDRRDMKPMRAPRAPSVRELAAQRRIPRENLHQSWVDWLYWDVQLEG